MYITREPIYGNFKSKFILIKDSVEESGVKLLKAVINSILKENGKLHIVQYELKNLDSLSTPKDNVSKTDAVSDPVGWNDLSKAGQCLTHLSVLSQFCSDFKGIICFDSLSPLLIHNNTNNVYKTLHKILKDNSDLQVIALMHADVHDTLENELMEKLATTVLHIIPDEDKCLSVIKYSSGKVSSQLVEYKISESREFSVLREFHSQIKPVVKQPDPTANLTFNLRLKDNEKEARSQVQLPYLQVQNNDVIEPECDMYDEEDPDDDLDI